MTTANKFPDTNESKRFARNFLERIVSLQRDVVYCLQPPYAPFPAILYCLATRSVWSVAGRTSFDYRPRNQKEDPHRYRR